MITGAIKLLSKTVHSVKNNGLRTTWYLSKRKLDLRILAKKQATKVLPDERLLQEQREFPFIHMVRISILTPLYNTPEKFLMEMIDSVAAQTYPNWELCLCDASDARHAYIEKICEERAAKDKRIRYKRLEKNDGISGNTNECIQIASGDYFALLDHDDILHPCALFEAAKAIVREGADFIYTDEAKFDSSIQDYYDPAYKPDFAKDELRAHNYICHFTVYSRMLFELVGPYDKTKDGSQDHDMVLRLTEKAEKIVHIPKILYFWRAHTGSVATGVEAKSYAIQAGIDAVASQLKRQNELGEVHIIYTNPPIYKVEYVTNKNLIVSVIVFGDASISDLTRCINSLMRQTDPSRIELCILQENRDAGKMKEMIKRYGDYFSCVFWLGKQGKKGDELNTAVKKCHGEILFFLHAETELSTGDWAKEMLMYVERRDVGAIGLKILDKRNRIYSAGIALDKDNGCLLHHLYCGLSAFDPGYSAALKHTRNVSILAGTGFMISKRIFDLVGGFREKMDAYQFADLCLRLREQGLLVVWIPFAAAVYRGTDPVLLGDNAYFNKVWNKQLENGDPYYNPNVKEYRIF